MHVKRLRIISGTVLLLLLSLLLKAQTVPQYQVALRYEVDAKRLGVAPESEEALPASRSFLKIDSTYYVGWMYEGIYRATHAADYLGYKNAIAPLQKALTALERDYSQKLKVRTGDLATFYPSYIHKVDYSQVAYYLYTCYSNIEEMEAAYALLRRAIQWNFQKDYYLDPYNSLAWIVHRNRFYSSDKFSFLKNSIDSNEALAHRFLDSGLLRIEKNKKLNTAVFGPGAQEAERMAVYHYKSILHSYALQIDSAEHYYGLMSGQINFPHNNYATLQTITGNFDTALAEYALASQQEAGDKRLQEWAYYSSLLWIYEGQPEKAIQLLQNIIKANGSTPGFGWYNLALARAYYYNGQAKEAALYLKKAEQFNELHIGTSLGKSHYDFAIQVQKWLQLQMKIKLLKFEDKRWWLRPKNWGSWIRFQFEKWVQLFVLVQQLSQNPERERVVYKIFSTENVVGWDELHQVIQSLGANFFVKQLTTELKDDKRPKIKKYFKLVLAALHLQKGDNHQANEIINDLLSITQEKNEGEQLFRARLFQQQVHLAKRRDEPQKINDGVQNMYKSFPQLLPASGLPMNFYLKTEKNFPPQLLKRLKLCHIHWENRLTENIPTVHLAVLQSQDLKWLTYTVSATDRRDRKIEGRFSFKDENAAAVRLAYRLFNVGVQNVDSTFF